MSRISCLLAALLLAAVACEPTVTPLALPAGLSLSSLSPAQRALLRATLTIDDVKPDETTVVLDVDTLTLTGDVELDNVGSGGEKTATLRIYGRAAAESEEVLLGLATSTATITPKQPVYLDFKGATFESCGAGVDGACSVLFDRNRNRSSNIADLVANIDPAPAAPFLQASPSTLQFSSGIRLGSFARQVVVVENLGDHGVRIDAVQVAGGQGVGVSLFDPATGSSTTPRRRLSATELNLDDDPEGISDIVLSPGEELFVAVSFAPVNAFLTTASIQIAATDVVTGVGQGVRTKVIANSDGALRPRDAGYVEPATAALNVGGGSLTPEAFPATELFSGSDVTATSSSAGLNHTGVSLIATRADGSTLAMPADAAFAIDIASGQRFAAALDADDDVDLALLERGSDGSFTVLSTSQQQGDSSEAVELLNDTASARSVVVVLGRIGVFAPKEVPGAQVAEDQPLPFRLSCQLTRGPELDDVTPIAPTRGRLDGGDEVVLRGRGFYVPPTSAGPHVRVSIGGEPVVVPPRIVTAEDGTQTLTVVLPSGTNSISDVLSTVVVENPSTNGGDGQAATLPEGFRYDLPTARITRVAPDVASTAGSTVDVTIRGAFFFDLYGVPVVKFDDDVASDVTVVDSTTLLVTAPPHATGLTQLTVTNVVFGQLEGAPSNAVDFTFVEPQGAGPTLTSVAPASGSALGGDVVTLSGADFDVATRVFLGGNEAVVTGGSDDSLTVITPPVDAAGAVDVTVVNPDGQAAVLVGAFTFALPPPSIAATFPDRASTSGNTIVVVTGAGFRDDTAVSFTTTSGSIDARSVTRTSSTTLLVTTPPAAAGAAELVARNPDGQQASTSFTFFAPNGAPPSALTINPSTGNVGGGTSVSLTATGVREPVVVVFGDTVINNATVVALANGRSRVDVTTPPGQAGNTAVSLVNADGQAVTATFTYIDTDEPRLVGLRPSTVHALITGDEILGFGEHLSDLGSTSALAATAVIQASTLPPQTVRVPLRVQFGSDSFVSLLVEQPLPAGTVAVELKGAGLSVISEQRLAAVPPDVTQVTFTEGGADIVLAGSSLAGDRLTAVIVGGAPCVITAADERFISCRLTDDPDEAVVSLAYGSVNVVDSVFALVETDGGEQCTATTCNGHGTCINDGAVTCVCDGNFAGDRCDSCAPGFSGPACDEELQEPILVTDAVDRVVANGLCSLREALQAVSGSSVADCAVPPGSTRILLLSDITLTAASGGVAIDVAAVLDGGEHVLSTSGNGLNINGRFAVVRDLVVQPQTAGGSAINVNNDATLTRVTVRNFVGTAPAITVTASAKLTASDCLFEGNENLSTSGGALAVLGEADLKRSRFVNNRSSAGGAIFVGADAHVSIAESAFHQNQALLRGGAIAVQGPADPLRLERCSVTNNSTSGGGAGGLHVEDATLQLVQTTIAGNSATSGVGGVMALRASLEVSSSTIALNSGSTIGGVSAVSGTVQLKNSIIARNNGSSLNRDLESSTTPSLQGKNVIVALNATDSLLADPALRIADPAITSIGFVGDQSLDVLQPSLAASNPLTSDCSDLGGVVLTSDQAGRLRPSTDCSIGAAQVRSPTSTQTITVQSGLDNGLGCTLRSAVEAARTQSAVAGCDAGGELTTIVFGANVQGVTLNSELDIEGAELVIDGLENHNNSVVTIARADGGRVMTIGSPTRIVGVQLAGNGFSSQGGLIAVAGGIARLEEVTLSGGSSDRGGAIFVGGGTVSFVRSTAVGGGATQIGGSLFVTGSGAAFLERSTIVGVAPVAEVVAANTTDTVVLDRTTFVGNPASAPLFGGSGVVLVHRSILQGSARPICGALPVTSMGANVFSDASCPLRAVDRQQDGVLGNFANHGGRTDTLSVTATNIAFTTCDGVDQRGREVVGQCPPGSFFAGAAVCGDGFIDGAQGVSLVVDQAPFVGFVGQTLVGAGVTPSGPGVVLLDDASGIARICTRDNGCGPDVATGVSNAVAVGAGDIDGDVIPDIVVIGSDGTVSGHDAFTGSTIFNSTFVFLDDVVDAHVVENAGTLLVFGVGVAGGQTTAEVSHPAGGVLVGGLTVSIPGPAQPGLALRRQGSVLQLMVRSFEFDGTVSNHLVTHDPTGDSLTVAPNVPGTVTAGSNVPSTIAADGFGFLWGAQQLGFDVSIGKSDANIDLPVTFDGQALTSGSIDGDGSDDIIAVGINGELAVFQQSEPFNWARLDVNGQALPGRCIAADVGGTAAVELVCSSAGGFQIAHFDVGLVDETCDPGTVFGLPCSATCEPLP